MPLDLENVQSGYNLAVINENFQRIEDTWDEKLDRVNSGSFYNQMEQELDMNSNHIINSPVPTEETHLVRLKELNDLVFNAEATGVLPLVQPRQVGDGNTTVFAAPNNNVVSAATMFISIDGVMQRPFTDYDVLAANQVTFTEAVPNLATVDITYFEPRIVDAPEAPTIYNTVADMVAMGGFSVGVTLQTRGYYSAGDGGGATYLITAGNTGDGYSSHDIGNNTATIQLLSNTVHLKQHGLLLDGVTEQSSVLQAALNFSEGSTVVGEGLVYTTAVVNVPSNISLRGRWGVTSGSGNCDHNGFDLDQVENVLLEDTIIKGVEGEDGFDAAIRIISSSNITLRRVQIDNIGQYQDTPNERGQGIFIRPIVFDAGTDMNNDINIENCNITNIKGNGAQRGDFIEIRRTRNINVSNCYFKGSNRMGLAITNQVSGCNISGNHILDAGLAAIDVESNEQNEDARDIIIDGNYINNWGAQNTPFPVGVQQYGIDLHPTSNRVVITNNNFDTFNNPNARGFIFVINSSREYIISNNTFSGATTETCVKLFSGGASNRGIISGNTFRYTTQGIFDVSLCKDIHISNCVVDAQSPATFVYMQDGNNLTVRDCTVNYTSVGIYVGGFGASSVNPNVFIDNIRMTRVTERAVQVQMDNSSLIEKLNITNISAESDGTPSESTAFSVVGTTSLQNSYLIGNRQSGWTLPWSVSGYFMKDYKCIWTDATVGDFIGQTAFIFSENQLAQWDGTVWVKP